MKGDVYIMFELLICIPVIICTVTDAIVWTYSNRVLGVPIIGFDTLARYIQDVAVLALCSWVLVRRFKFGKKL